jgi:hypothetical protein
MFNIYLGQKEYDFQKSRVTALWSQKDLVSVKNKTNISCLCTFKRMIDEHAHNAFMRMLSTLFMTLA